MSTTIGQEPKHDETMLLPSQRRSARRAPSAVSPALPGWENFTLQDRQRLIHLLVQTARRQVQSSRMQGDEEGTR